MTCRINDQPVRIQATFSEAWAAAPSCWARVTLVARRVFDALFDCLCCINTCCAPESYELLTPATISRESKRTTRATSAALQALEPKPDLYVTIYDHHQRSSIVDPAEYATRYSLNELKSLCNAAVEHYTTYRGNPLMHRCLVTVIMATTIAACHLLKEGSPRSRKQADDAELIGTTPHPSLFNFIGNSCDNMVRQFSIARAEIEIASADQEDADFKNAIQELLNRLFQQVSTIPASFFQSPPPAQTTTTPSVKNGTRWEDELIAPMLQQPLVTYPITDLYQTIYHGNRPADRLSLSALTALCHEALSHHNDLRHHILTDSPSAENARLSFPQAKDALRIAIHLACEIAYSTLITYDHDAIQELEELWLKHHDQSTLPHMIAASLRKMMTQLEQRFGPRSFPQKKHDYHQECRQLIQWIDETFLNPQSDPLNPDYNPEQDPLSRFTFPIPARG